MNVGNNTNCRMWHRCTGFIIFGMFCKRVLKKSLNAPRVVVVFSH